MQLMRWLWIAPVLLGPSPSRIEAQVHATGSDAPSAMHERGEVPFKLYQSYLIVVQGSLGTLERLNLLIDTGANATSVDYRIARKLGLKGQQAKLALVNQPENVRRVTLPNLRLGPVRAESLPVLVQDLSFVQTTLGVRVDAIVGLDFLGRSSFAVDYESKKMVFGSIDPACLAIPFKHGAPTVTVEVRLNGQPVRLLIDTGARDLLLFERHLPEGLWRLPTLDVKRVFNSAAAWYETKEVIVSKVQLGASDRRNQKAFVTPGNEHLDPFFDGAFGPASLGLKWIAFDFEHGSFGWR